MAIKRKKARHLRASLSFLAKESHQLPPELLPDAAVDDEVDGGVEDEEDVMDVRQDVVDGRHVKTAKPEALLEVLHRVGLWVSKLVDLQPKSTFFTASKKA